MQRKTPRQGADASALTRVLQPQGDPWGPRTCCGGGSHLKLPGCCPSSGKAQDIRRLGGPRGGLRGQQHVAGGPAHPGQPLLNVHAGEGLWRPHGWRLSISTSHAGKRSRLWLSDGAYCLGAFDKALFLFMDTQRCASFTAVHEAWLPAPPARPPSRQVQDSPAGWRFPASLAASCGHLTKFLREGRCGSDMPAPGPCPLGKLPALRTHIQAGRWARGRTVDQVLWGDAAERSTARGPWPAW